MWKPLLAACALAAVTVLVAHGGATSNGFVELDDAEYVYENPHVQAGLSHESIAWALGLGDKWTYYHPLTWLSLMLDRELFGADPSGYHAVNVALHAAAVVLLLLALVFATGRPWPSLGAALLFGAHPLTVDAVAWVTERKTVLSGALGAAAIVAYVAYARRPSAVRLATVVLMHALGLLAKPGLVVLPALLLVLDFWPLRRLPIAHAAGDGGAARPSVRAILLEKIPIALVSAASIAVTLLSARATSVAEEVAPLGLRVANAVASIPRYLAAAVWPSGLSVYHPYPQAVSAAAVAFGAAVVGVGTVLAVAAARRLPMLLAGWIWFLVALTPFLGVKIVGLWPAWGERFAYVPLMGLAAAVAFAAAEVAAPSPARRRAVAVGAVCAVVALGAATRVQVRYWRDSIALFERAVEVEPESAVMQHYYGRQLLHQAGRAADAEPHLAAAVRLDPKWPEAHAELGTALKFLGRTEEAAFQYRTTLHLDPAELATLFNYAELLNAAGRLEEARPYYARFLRNAPPSVAAQRWAAQRALAQ